MSIIETIIPLYELNRTRTLGLLDKVLAEPNPREVLAWQPGPGRAHIGWQLTHISVVEEMFASERLAPHKANAFPDLTARFKFGTTADQNVPSPEELRRLLDESRTHLLATLREAGDARLGEIPPALAERKLTVRDVLHILGWHEPHHQGQAHITFNLYKNRS
ncbi:MAG: DinB family protein [Planctomycetes bacterium]|nr:DinB family protein [Planctomycetota bacterium]